MVKLNGMRDRLDELSLEFDEGVQTGQIDKTKAPALFKQRSQEILGKGLAEVPEAHRQLGQADLTSMSERLGRKVERSVFKRDQSDTLSGINQTLEYAQRLAVDQPEIGRKLGLDTLDQLGPFSGMAPDQIAKAKQAFVEGVGYTQAFTLVNGAKQSNADLSKVEKRLSSSEFSDIDPQRKAALLTTIEGYKVANTQKAEAEARRRLADQERMFRKAEAEFNAAQSIISSGKVLSQEYVDQVSAATAGTPFALAFKESLKGAPERAAFGAQPLAVMDRALIEARAELNTKGTDPATEKRIRTLEAMRDEKRRGMAEDPLVASQEYGGPPVQPIDTSNIASLVESLPARNEAVEYASHQAGRPVSPLLKSEAESLTKMLAVMPVDQRSTAIAELSQRVGPRQAAAIGLQIGANDKALGIALGMAGSRTSEGRYTSEIVLRGAQALKDRAVKDDNAALTGVRAKVAAEIGDAYPNEEQRKTMIEAAVLTEYGLQSEGSGDLRRAVRLATGGIVERGGRKFPLPYGMSEDAFDKKLSALPADALASQLPDGKVYVGGTSMDAAAFVKTVPQAALIHAGQGRYAVQAGAGMVTNAAGRPVIVEVK